MHVSVVIPAFNAASFIEDTLRTVLDQDCRDFDIIVVDDGSVDGTADVATACLEGCGREWIVIRQANAGVSAARNAGWRASGSPWIQFLDADDFLAPTKIGRQLRACGSAPAEKSPAWVSSQWQWVDVDSGVRRTVRRMAAPEFGTHPSELRILAAGQLLTLGQSLFARAWIDRVGGFDPAIKVDEDLDFYLRLARSGATHHTVPGDEPLFAARQQLHRRLGASEAKYSAHDLSKQFLAHVMRVAASDPRGVRALPAADRDRLHARCSQYLRLLFHYDRKEFRRMLGEMARLFDGFAPHEPKSLRALSAVIGFETAEEIAGLYRQFKTWTGLQAW